MKIDNTYENANRIESSEYRKSIETASKVSQVSGRDSENFNLDEKEKSGFSDDSATVDISAHGLSEAAYMSIQSRLDAAIREINNEKLTADDEEEGSKVTFSDNAEEMIAYSMANILSQAGIAMSSQANMVPESLMQLLM